MDEPRFPRVLVLLLYLLVAAAGPACARAELSTDFANAISKVPRSHPDVFQVNQGALEFVKKHHHKKAVAFLRLKARESGNKSVGQLAACLGLAQARDHMAFEAASGNDRMAAV